MVNHTYDESTDEESALEAQLELDLGMGGITREFLGLISEEELAAALSVTTQTLATWRHHADGPVYAKLGKRVFYRCEDVQEWVKASLRAHPGEGGDWVARAVKHPLEDHSPTPENSGE